MKARIRAAQTFDEFDADKNGRLDKTEFAAFFSEMQGLGLVTGTCDGCMLRLDTDGSGSIDFFEFCKWLDSCLSTI